VLRGCCWLGCRVGLRLSGVLGRGRLGCEDVDVIWTVRVAAWELEENGRVLTVGDEVSSWLTFHEADAMSASAQDVQTIRGRARPLPTWPGGGFGAHPVQIDLAAGALYWDAPDQVEGAVEVVGTVCTNNIDAPDGFPETTGVVRRTRMDWRDYVMGSDKSWRGVSGGPRYEEVPETYFPPVEIEAPDPEVESELNRRARQAYDREVSSGRLKPGDPFTVVLATAPRRTPPGVTETRWTGVLIDLEITGIRQV
jgi:hypothetical protein